MPASRYSYCANAASYCNKCDHAAMQGLVRESMSDAEHSHRRSATTVLVVGTFDGSDIMRLVSQPWWRPAYRVFAWEIQRPVWERATALLRAHSEVVLFHQGVSDARGRLAVNGANQTAGLWECWNGVGAGCGGGRPRALANVETVAVTSWADFAAEQQLKEVAYALIDVEGHEVKVLRGMRLEERAHTFPLFQYELGGTWADSRHATNWTQADAAAYLEGLGYTLYLMGERGSGSRGGPGPVLMPVTHATFRAHVKCGIRPGSHAKRSGPFPLHGNALAVHSSLAQRRPRLRGYIASLVAAGEELGAVTERCT